MLHAAVAFAQTATVRVEVRSEAGPVRDADVVINGTTHKTDAQGVVVLTLPPGHTDIVVVKEGFAPASAFSVDLQANQQQPVVIELNRGASVEEHVTVSATRTDKRVEDVPMRVEVLNTEEVQEQVMQGPGDVVNMLREMGGLHVASSSPSLGAASVRIQGMKGRYTRFLSDGLPLFGEQVGGLGLLQIPPVDLGQVEVIKGVGIGALRRGRRRRRREPDCSPADGEIAGIPAQSLVARRNRRRRLPVGPPPGRVGRDAPRRGPRARRKRHRRRRVGRLTRLQARGSASASVLGQPQRLIPLRHHRHDLGDADRGTTAGAVLPATQLPYRETLDTGRYDVGLVGQTLVSNTYVLSARASGTWQSHDHAFGDVLERDHHNTFFGELSVRRKFGRQTVVAGAAFERDAFDARDTPQFSYAFNVPGLFVQDDVDVAPWLSLSGSARLDVHSEYGTFVSPRVSALLRSGGWTSRLSVGTGFFPTTPLTEETEAAGLSRLTIRGPLRAETGQGASMDVTRTIGPFSSTVTVFASRLEHPVFVDRTDAYVLANQPFASTNVGAELLTTWRREPVSLTAVYDFIHAREFEDTACADVPLTPRHAVTVLAGLEDEDVGRFVLEWFYTGRQRLEVNPFRDQSAPYMMIGVLAERAIGKVRVFVNGENLMNVRQTQFDPLIRPMRGVDGRWTVDAWAPLDGRNINGGIRVKF